MDLSELPNTSFSRHPWETARADFFSAILKRHVFENKISRILDVGAGDAFFANQLSTMIDPEIQIVCTDIHYDPTQEVVLRSALASNVRLVRELPKAQADVVLLLDVLEHIEDDAGFLGQLVDRSLVSGGWLLVSVPSWQMLFSRHDSLLSHYRRYSPTQARKLLTDVGLSIFESGGLFHTLLLPRVLQKLGEEMGLGAAPVSSDANGEQGTDLGKWRHGPFLTELILTALRADNLLSGKLSQYKLSVPGLSWWAICRKCPR